MHGWNKRRISARGALGFLPLIWCAGWPATAAEDGDGPAIEALACVVTPARLPVIVPPPLQVLRVAGVPGAIGDARLAELRGGSASPWSDMKLNGTVGNNTAINVASGANIITEGAFANASGLPMVIQNSGANVLIQNATIVNVQFQ